MNPTSGDDLQFDRPWHSDPGLHRRHRNCLAEIRELLSRNEATEWGGLSTRLARELESPRLLLVQGIEIVRDWIYELRQLMRLTRVSEIVASLPVPEGKMPTMVPIAGRDVMSDGGAVARMREVIAEHERKNLNLPESVRGKNASSRVLIDVAGLRRTEALKALRRLQEAGEYNGFIHNRQRRHESK